MKFHIKSSLIFLLITMILLVGVTAISATDVDNTQTQEIIEHTEVSTTSYEPVSKDVQAETVKTDNNLNEEEKTIEKVNNTKTNTNTITKSPAIQSSNAAVKTLDYNGIHWDDNKVVYVNWYNHEHSYSYNWQTQTVTANELGDGSRNNPTSIYNAIKIVPQNGVIVLLHNPDNMTNNNGETVYETRPNAPWVNRGGGANYYPGAPNQYSTIDTFTIIGEPGYTIVWSGKRHNTNMFSLSEMYNATLMNIVFRDGNASGIPSGQQGRNGGTADHGGAIDNRGKLQVINCTFENILANENGGAIANYEKAVTLIENCTFKNITSTNSANFQGDPNEKYGGAISVNKTNGFSQTPQVTVRNSNFTDIEAEYGGVFYNNHGILNVENVIIDGSTATTEGGAIINLNNGVTTLTNVNMSNLEAVDYGGAVANLGGTVNLDNVDINHVVITKTAESEYFGGTIYVAEDATITIKNSHLEDMTATHGAVFNVEGGILTVEDTEIENAIATTFGGLACIQDGHVIMDNVKVNNVCTSVDPNDYQKGNGALFLAEMGTIEVSNSNFTNNKGRAGTIGFFFFAEATFENNNFINNEATGKDNYLIESMYSDTTFKNNYFENNTNNYRDMLSVNETSRSGGYDNPTMEGNTYIDNTLDHTISFKINGVLKTFTSESEIPLITPENPITPVPLINITLNDTDHQTNTTDVELDLRSPYADLEEDGGVKNGTIQILKDDEVLYDNIIVTDSTANIIFDVNDFDTYNTTLTLKYTSDKHFLNKTYLFTVYKITNTTTEVNCDDVPVFDPVDISGTVKDYENVGANGSLIIRFDDPENETYIEFPDGVVDGVYDVFVTPDLPVGEHTVYVQYAGLTDRFNASANSIKFNVLKRNVTLTLDDIDDVTVRDKPTITGIVLDEAEGTPITEGKVRLTITGENGTSFIEEVDVNSDGTFEYPDYIADKSGHYDVVAKYLGTENYNESEEVTKGFNADKIPTTTSLDDFEVITVGDSIVVTGKLTETESGVAIPGAKLNITVPGLDEPIEVTTDEDGKFTTNGVAEIKIENTTMNKVTATYAGNDTYVESSDVKDLTVQEAPTNITINTGDEITAHVPTTATFTLYDVNGNIAPNGINDAGVTVTIVDEYGNNLNTTTVTTGPDGSITVGYTPVTDGEITYTAVYNGKTYVFKDCQNETKRDDVQSIDTEMTVTVDDTVINGTTTVVVDLADANGNPVNGTIQFVCDDGTVLEAVPVDGTTTHFEVPFDNTHEGKDVNVKATFVPAENSGYTASEDDDDFNVAKLNTTVEINPGSPVAHNDTVATITLKNSTASVPGEDILVTIVDEYGNVLNGTVVNTGSTGSVDVHYTPVTNGTITIIAVFNGNETENVYNGNSSSKNVEVTNIDTKLVVNAPDTRINGTSVVSVDLTDANDNPVNNGTIVLHFSDGTPDVTITIPDGNTETTFTSPFTNTPIGKNVTVTAEFIPDETSGYNTQTANDKFEVIKLDTNITIDVSDVVAHQENNVTLTLVNVNDSKVIPGEELSVVIKDEFGNELFNGTVPTGPDGSVNVPFVPVTDGKINITVSFAETDEYLSSANRSDDVEVANIKTDLNVSAVDTRINGTSDITVNITDANGKPVNNGTIVLHFSDGTPDMNITIPNGNTDTEFPFEFTNTSVGKDVTVTAEFVPDEHSGYDPIEKTDDFNVAKLNTSVDIEFGDVVAHNASTVTITLNNINDTVTVPGEKFNVTITDELGNVLFEGPVDVPTDADGRVNVTFVPVTDTPVTVVAEFAETDVYLESSNEDTTEVGTMPTSLNVTIEDTVINGTTTVVVDIADENGNPVNGIIEFVCDDGTVLEAVPVDGTTTQIEVPFDNTHVGKNVTVTATFVPAENSGYDPASGEDDFEVGKLPTSIEIDSGNPVAHNETIAVITLKNSTANVPNEPVNVTIVDKEGNVLFNDTVNTTEEGIIEVPYTPVTGSPINITAVFDGNPEENVYIGSENSIEVTPAMMETTLVLNSTDTIVDGTSTIGVNVTDANGNPVNGTVDLTIKDDKGNEYNVSVPVENGIGNYTYPSENTDMGKIVDVTGHYVENKTLGYAASPEADTQFEVAKLNTTVDLVVNNATVTNFTVNITVTGKDTDRTVEDGPVTIYANGTKVGEAEIIDGKAENVWLNITEIGDYELTVEYGGNDVFNENNTFATDVTAIKINTTTTVEVVNNTVGNVTLEAVVKDVNGNIVNEGVVNITAVDEEGNEYYIGEAEIVDGKAIIKNDTLTGNEEYVFTANFEGTPTYNISNGTTTEEIVTRPTTTTIEVLNNTLENVTVKVTVVDNETGNPIPFGDVEITLPNGTVITVKTDENGENVTTFDDIPVGEDKEFDANYLGNDTYSPSEDTTTTDIIPRPSITTPVVTNNTAGNVTLDVHVTDAEDGRDLTEGNVTIYAKLQGEGDDAYVPVGNGTIDENGMVTIVTNITTIGNYTFRADFEGNENYTESNGTTDSEVVGRLADIGATPGNTTLGNSTVIVSLNDTVTGEPLVNATVIITLPDGSEVNGTITPDGTVEVPVDLPVGNHTLPVRYEGNETYNATNTTVDIEILPRPSEITGEVINNTAKNVTINATVLDAETKQPVPNGPVVAKVNGTVVGTGEVINGTAIIPTDLDKIGDYDVELEYLGNENYTESNTTVHVDVVGRPSDITAVPGNETLGNSTVNITLVDPETNEPIPFAPVIITLPNGTEVPAVTDENGTVEVPVDLPVGPHTLNVTYPGNETYSPSNTTVDMNILPRPSEITGEVINNTAKNVTINATVTDAETGLPVPNGPVVAKVNGTVVGTGEVINGTAIIPTDLDKIGDYDVELEYLGNENYTESNTTVPVDVVGRPSDITAEPGNETLGNSTVNITLVDPETNEPIPFAPVIITLPNGTQVNGTTDENGTVEVPVDLPVGPHTLNVTYPGNETYSPSNTTVDMNILPRPSEIEAELINNTAGNVTIKATVTDAETGELVPNGPVEVYVNGTLVGTGEVVDGIAIIKTNITEIGNYDFDVEYLGNENYTESNTTVNDDVVGRPSDITAEPGNETLGNSTVNITLVDPETNEPIPFAPVIITLPDGTNITATTDENGTVEVPVDLPVGPHTLNVTYPGNETYAPSNTTVDLTINPRPSDIEAEVVNNTPGNVTITANVTDAETGLPVPNGPVEVYVNGTLVSTGEVVDGKVTIVTDITEPGSYDFDVRYLGNENYTSSDDDVPADVVSRETEISGDVINNIIGDTEIEITLKDPVTGDLLANKEVIVTLPDGTNVTAVTGDDGKVRLPLDLPAGPNDLVLTFAGDDEYEASTSPMVVDVVKRNATLTPEVVNRTPGKAVIEITAIDDLTGKPVVNGTIELTLADGTKVRAVTDENGVARFENVTVPKGGYNYDAKLLENPIYNEADTNVTVKPIKIKITIKIGDWKLVCVVDEPENGDIDYKDVINRHVPKYKAQKAVRANRASRYSTPGKYRKYSPRKYRPAWNRGRPHFVPTHRLSKAKYQLYIYLYSEYFNGELSYSDFVAILKANGIEITSSNAWDENGMLVFEYDSIEDVPDSFDIHDNSGHTSDSSQNIDKSKDTGKSGVVDSGNIEVEIEVEA